MKQLDATLTLLFCLKKSEKTPQDDLKVACQRLAQLRGEK